jgi:Lon protease-like protein
VTTALPLFPLGSVLFPGLVLPLHVFEQRYLALVRDLMDRPEGEPREFGVVAIRRGWEVDGGSGDDLSLFEVGCTAEVRQVTELEGGRLDIVTVGRRRFHLDRLIDGDTPYLQAEVSYVPEPPAGDPAADTLAPRALAVFRAYLSLIRGDGTDEISEQLPEDPTVLSHLIAATASLTVADRQALLAEPDTAGRLRAELTLLHREVGLLRQVRAVPVPVSELPVRPGPN